MPLTHFRCPDNEVISIKNCLAKCRLKQRCLTLPTLITIVSGRREWKGIPSTTQLLNGTMLEYLKIKRSYAVTPTDMAFSLLGTTHHEKLAAINVPKHIIEKTINEPNITGTPDLLEPSENGDNTYNIVDYKTYGSYPVTKLLGIVGEKAPHPTEIYARSGKWGSAGSPKMITKFKRDPSKIDDFKEAMQLNSYRLLAESQGYTIDKLLLQITVRDGNTIAARNRGVFDNIYYPVEVRRLPDNEVRTYYERKRHALITAIETNTMPDICNDEENWGGKRCESYCEVATFCPKGQTVARQKVNA